MAVHPCSAVRAMNKLYEEQKVVQDFVAAVAEAASSDNSQRRRLKWQKLEKDSSQS